MKNVLRELRAQPMWVRELMFVLCLTITASTVGLVWFNSYETELFALIHVKEREYQAQLAEQKAEEKKEAGSLVANLGQVFSRAFSTTKNIQAAVMNGLNGAGDRIEKVFDFDSKNDKKDGSSKNSGLQGTTYMLPLSEDR